MTVLRARGSELEVPFAYGVVRQLFDPSLARLADDQRSRLFGGAAMHAAPIFDPAQVVDVAATGEDVAMRACTGCTGSLSTWPRCGLC